MRRFGACLIMAVGLITQLSCSATGPSSVGTTYTLDLVNGAPLPAVIGTIEDGGAHYEKRVVSSVLVLIDRDSVRYVEMRDLVKVLSDGSREPTGYWLCLEDISSYTRPQFGKIAVNIQAQGEAGASMPLDIAASLPFPPLIGNDTLVVTRDSLVQAKAEQRLAFHADVHSSIPEPSCGVSALKSQGS